MNQADKSLKDAVEDGERSVESDLFVNDVADAGEQKHRPTRRTEDVGQED